jgi:hypothetical protein
MNADLLGMNRSDRKRLRAFQIRRRFAKSLRRAELALVRRPPHLLRVIAGNGFPRSVLQVEQRRGLCARRLLQLHTQEGTDARARAGSRYEYEKVVEGEGEGY